MEEYNKLNGK
ncbi:hypothetical protein SOVF_158510, partial [Spinacia oleracea]